MSTPRKRRTNVDFSEHVVTKTESKELLIHYLAKPNTRCCAVKFINTQGIMAITGDYGNWIFCREFHPSHDGFVSAHYWCEKLQISSTQKYSDFSSYETEKDINKRLTDDEDLSDEDKEYLNDLLNYVHECEERYMVYAYDNLPKDRDHEFIPLVKKLNPWLEVIFDAFEEICKREPLENIKG